MSILLDAGPALNFLAVSKHSLLIAIADQAGLELAAPERVSTEILNKACNDNRFKRTAAASAWRKLTAAERVNVLSDELTDPVFTQAVTRISGVNAAERVRSTSSLGEIMALAHASALAQQCR